jgi:hypothetical protein
MSYISEKGFAGKVMNEALAVDYGRFNNESKGKVVIIQEIKIAKTKLDSLRKELGERNKLD